MSESPLDLPYFKDRLLHLRQELSQDHQSGEEAAQTVELDQTRVGRVSRMDALQHQAIAKDAQQRRLVQLQRVDAALRRLENGEFGFCVRCGEEIPLKRLEFDPTAPICVACAQT